MYYKRIYLTADKQVCTVRLQTAASGVSYFDQHSIEQYTNRSSVACCWVSISVIFFVATFLFCFFLCKHSSSYFIAVPTFLQNSVVLLYNAEREQTPHVHTSHLYASPMYLSVPNHQPHSSFARFAHTKDSASSYLGFSAYVLAVPSMPPPCQIRGAWSVRLFCEVGHCRPPYYHHRLSRHHYCRHICLRATLSVWAVLRWWCQA